MDLVQPVHGIEFLVLEEQPWNGRTKGTRISLGIVGLCNLGFSRPHVSLSLAPSAVSESISTGDMFRF